MSKHELSEFERARAGKLGQELADKLAKYFSAPMEDEQIAELRALRDQLEKIGFIVKWDVGIDPKTGEYFPDVNLWIPNPTTEKTELPQK